MAAHKVQHVALTFDDGSVGIMQFILDPRLPQNTVLPGLTESGREATDEAIQHEINKSSFSGLKVSTWRKIDASEIPGDRTYRGAWKDDGKTIVHDMVKARELHRSSLPEPRRDDPRIENATTIDVLKRIT